MKNSAALRNLTVILSRPQAQLMHGVWDDRFVTASSHVPSDLVAAILAGGAKAVVCAAEDAEPPADAAAAFFRSLFGLLGSSVSLLQVGAMLIH